MTSGTLREQPSHGTTGVQDLPTTPPEKLWGEESENAPMGFAIGAFLFARQAGLTQITLLPVAGRGAEGHVGG